MTCLIPDSRSLIPVHKTKPHFGAQESGVRNRANQHSLSGLLKHDEVLIRQKVFRLFPFQANGF